MVTLWAIYILSFVAVAIASIRGKLNPIDKRAKH
jgi:hypothetical protein